MQKEMQLWTDVKSEEEADAKKKQDEDNKLFGNYIFFNNNKVKY